MHSVRVSVRNSGSAADAEDSGTLPIEVTSGSGATVAPSEWQLARMDVRRGLERFRHQAPPVSLSVTAGEIASTAAGGPQRYSFYTPELSLMSETSTSTGPPTIAYDYLWFGGQPVAQVEASTGAIAWYFNDHLGTPVLQTDATGGIVWRAEYEPYGKVVQYRVGATRHQPLRFPGQEYDGTSPETEYNIFRWYRSSWGKYAARRTHWGTRSLRYTPTQRAIPSG